MLFAIKTIGSKWLYQGNTGLYICFSIKKGSAGRSLATPDLDEQADAVTSGVKMTPIDWRRDFPEICSCRITVLAVETQCAASIGNSIQSIHTSPSMYKEKDI